MAKAVLVMDMPESCFGCNFCHINSNGGEDCCQALEVSRAVNSETYEKPEWCPLRELPEKKEEFELRECKGSVKGAWKVPLIENKGFNSCLDEILKEKKVGRLRMKILSKKKYNKLIEDFEELQKKVEELKRINESLEKKLEDNEKKLEDKKTSCKLNYGKDFCFKCENSYRYKAYWGKTEYEKCGCLLDIPCEDFKKKEDN